MLNNKKLSFLVVCSLTISIFLTACSPLQTPPKQSPSSAVSSNSAEVRQSFEEFTDKIARELISSSGISLHFTLKNPANYGITEPVTSIGDYSIETAKSYKQQLNTWLTELKAFNRTALTKEEQLTYDIMLANFSLDEKYADLYLYYDPFNPMNGEHGNLPYSLSEYHFYDDAAVVEDYLVLLQDFDNVFDQLILIERERAKKGIFMQDFSANKVISQLNEFIAPKEGNYLITSFDERVANIQNAEEYKAQNKKIVMEEIIPAYQKAIAALTELKGSAKTTGALCDTPDGKKYYEYLVASNTGTQKSVPDFILALESKIDELNKIQYDITDRNPDVLTQFEALKNPTPDAMDALKSLRELSAKDFPTIKESDIILKDYPKAHESSGSVASFFSPPLDDNSANSIYINQSLLTPESPTAYTTLAHEGFPGHMYQINYFMQTEPMLIRHILNFIGYTEGWTTYIEQFAIEYAQYGDSDLTTLAQIQGILPMLIISRIDLAVHYEGLSQKAAIEMFVAFGYSSSDAKFFYEMIVGSPGTYLPYGGGFIEMQALQTHAKHELGKKYDSKQFHKAVLDVGPAPYSLVTESVNQYISSQK